MAYTNVVRHEESKQPHSHSCLGLHITIGASPAVSTRAGAGALPSTPRMGTCAAASPEAAGAVVALDGTKDMACRGCGSESGGAVDLQ